MIPFWKKTGKDGKKKPQKPAVPRTAQQSIPMQRMFEDGTCRVKANYYTRTIQYQDINYQLAQKIPPIWKVRLFLKAKAVGAMASFAESPLFTRSFQSK